MRNRENLARQWLTETLGYSLHEFSPVPGDASFRRYFRAHCQQGNYILMDAPPPEEDCSSFIDITQRFIGTGVRTPALCAYDIEQGFVLLEDLGNHLFLHCLSEENADHLYHKAIDTLLKIQAVDHARLQVYEETLLMEEMYLFPTWYCTEHLEIELSIRHRQIFEDAFRRLAENALAQPVTFVHRDYHSRNLMVLEDDDDVGVLDYQDAVAGPITYDLVSLLKDCYIDWPQSRIDAWIAYFRERCPNDSANRLNARAFRHHFNLMGVQRHFKASGIFARLCHRDHKTAYLSSIPRTLNYIIGCLAHEPEFADLCRLMLELPPSK